jgi:hypothetical protein
LVNSNEKSLGAVGVVPGTTVAVEDAFNGQSQFNGLDLGFKAEVNGQRWWLGMLAKVALGAMHEEVVVSGRSTITVPGQAPIALPGGLLALSSNIGRFGSQRFAAIPELGLTAGWNFTPNIKVRVGYSFLLLDEIVRGSDQASLGLNPNLFPPPATTGNRAGLPIFQTVRSDMWVQTINLGVEFRY